MHGSTAEVGFDPGTERFDLGETWSPTAYHSDMDEWGHNPSTTPTLLGGSWQAKLVAIVRPWLEAHAAAREERRRAENMRLAGLLAQWSKEDDESDSSLWQEIEAEIEAERTR